MRIFSRYVNWNLFCYKVMKFLPDMGFTRGNVFDTHNLRVFYKFEFHKTCTTYVTPHEVYVITRESYRLQVFTEI